MSILKALSPLVPENRYGIVTESMLDGTYRVNIDGRIRRVSSSVATPPGRGSRVVIGVVSGRETIISIGLAGGMNMREVSIHG